MAKARGRVGDAKSLADSLGRRVKLARALRSDPKSALAEQLEDGGVTNDLLAEVEALAARVGRSPRPTSISRTASASPTTSA